MAAALTACCAGDAQKPKEAGGKPVSDQWIPPFVIVDDKDRPVGPIEVTVAHRSCIHHTCMSPWRVRMCGSFP